MPNARRGRMTSQHFNWRPRINLLTFLVTAALTAPLISIIYTHCVKPRFRHTSWSWAITPSHITYFNGYVISRSRGSHDELITILVIPNLTTIDFGSSHRPSPPAAEGVSVRENLVFLDGKLITRRRSPCFLLFEPRSRSFLEVPIADNNRLYTGKLNIDDLPEWQRDVVPLLRTLQPATEAASILPQ